VVQSLNFLGVGVISTVATLAAIVAIAVIDQWRIWRQRSAWRRVYRQSNDADK
jgi:hypothetical protein